jgi:hypothetical protein
MSNDESQRFNENMDFMEKRMKVVNLTKDPLLQIEMFEDETAKERVLQLISVAQETLLYTRDTIEIHSSDLNHIYRAMLHLARFTKEDISEFEYGYVLSNLDGVTNKLIKSCKEIKTYSDSPMIGNHDR